ncbi:rhodanese-like domain-containing protein [Stenotrophobium rhamnosiphilum]|uniref:Rhodanese-like domain-containing protein n=1 Tax=Stenotrophobium rhamnosiphilum TaxID=2029166 RepID=A0A2T5MGB7_9GAMM|nr:rhodanese-like domain-containing protein [Stenotrophobium rhamnosiphilum]PTU31606.1 rhodanese-like domain-containing protein [Stenotrophobium rhamnosiphilum]
MEQLLHFVANHPILFVLFGAVLIALIANEVHGNLTGGKRLGTAEAVRLINDREPLIVDVRTSADFKRGHLLNALNLPIAKIEEQIGVLGKDKSRPVLVYCALGSSSVAAVDKLRKNGFTEAYPLQGGINNWQASNLPVTVK